MRHKPIKTDQEFVDPVCGMKVSYKTAPAILEYKNKLYCFCAPACREKFESDPEHYVRRQDK